MDLLLDAAEEQVRDSIESVLNKEFSLDRFRNTSPIPEADYAKWPLMAELGWFSLALEEELGGLGMSAIDEVTLFNLLGRHLVTPGVLGAVLGARIAALAGQNILSETIILGDIKPAVGIALPSASIGNQLSGEFYIVDDRDSTHCVVWDDQGAALLELPTDRMQQACLDESLQLTKITVTSLNTVAYIPTSQQSIYLRAGLLLAAMLAGVADGAKILTVDYVNVREQFGQPIGAFQAVKHRCSDMAVSIDVIESTLAMASVAFKEGANDGPALIASSVLLAKQAAQENSRAAIQLHGAMGFTEECHAHRFLKRARVLDLLTGNKHTYQNTLLSAANKKV